MHLPAQESIPEMNDRATMPFNTASNFSKNTHTSTFEKLMYVREQSIYTNSGTNNLQSQLLNSKNREIINYVKKANRNKKREFIAFAALPLGVAAAVCIRNRAGSAWAKPAGIGILAASLSCIIVSPIAHNRKAYNYRQAVKLYNLHF